MTSVANIDQRTVFGVRAGIKSITDKHTPQTRNGNSRTPYKNMHSSQRRKEKPQLEFTTRVIWTSSKDF